MEIAKAAMTFRKLLSPTVHCKHSQKSVAIST